MKSKHAILLLAIVMIVCGARGADRLAKWDPRMAESSAHVDTNGVKWIDGKDLPIEGRWTADRTDHCYVRLPDTLTTNVNDGVRGMRFHTSGMKLRFSTDSRFVIVRYRTSDGEYLGSGGMSGVGRSGWDAYRFIERESRWRFCGSSFNSSVDPADTSARVKKISLDGSRDCLINLPLYNGVRFVEIGIDAKSSFSPPRPYASGIDKPVVFYGTSITQGSAASRPGMAFVNRIGRSLDVPVLNLGFSGCGIMEYEMSEVLARVDASCYVLDCLWNMGDDAESRHWGERRLSNGVPRNYEPFVRNLRAKRPGVPIVLAEQCDVFGSGPNAKDRFVRALYEKLVAEGWQDLHYLPKEDMYADDAEGTIEGCHPNDWGMMRLSRAFGQAVKTALGFQRGGDEMQ